MLTILKRVCLVFLAISIAVVGVSIAQDKAKSDPAPAKSDSKEQDPRDKYSEAERPDENYLARFDAIRISEKLMKENLENIYMLKVIVSNFKDQGWEGDYKAIYEDYKKGVGYFYKRDVIYSRVELEKNRAAISQLCKKMVTYYKEQTRSFLSECADRILDFSLDERNKFDPNKSKVLFNNMTRLWIAYGQIDDAEKSSLDGVYKSSLFHLRVAKSFAISILEELDPEKSKGRFDVHKADNRNRVLEKKEK